MSCYKCSNLDRFLWDHRPILLREVFFDYGPTPFFGFVTFVDVDGLIICYDYWKDAPGDDSNDYGNCMTDQQKDLECMVSKEEWFCINGDDGFKTALIRLKAQFLSMGVLRRNSNSTKDVGMFNGIKLSSSLNISHLFYADDAIFLGQWNDSNIDTLVHVMECFYRVSGLRINLCKSKIMGIHVDADRIKSAASKLRGAFLVNSFRQNPRSGVEEFQSTISPGLVSTITLSYAVERQLELENIVLWNVDYVDVSSYEEMGTLGWYSL
ncbi:hypothetical protein Tco_0866463 [Tanacetum coccineum]